MKKIKFLIILLLIVIVPSVIFKISDNYFSERTSQFIKQQVTFITSNIFTVTIGEQAAEIANMSPIIQYKYDNNNDITSILVNTANVNRLVAIASNRVSSILESGLIESSIGRVEIPLGSLISQAIFANLGPNVKISTLPIMSYTVDFISKNVPYGINNTLFELYLRINIDIETIIPLQKQTVHTETDILVISQIVQGKVPLFYYNGDGDITREPIS